jgi:hypothetical protein
MLKKWRIKLEFTKEELLDLAKNVYENSCNGYLDLKDSCCFKIVSDFYDKKQKENEKISLNKNKDFYNAIVSSTYLVSSTATSTTY